LPPAERMNGGHSKVALRRVAQRWLPERIYARRKQGFVLPMRAWITEWLQSRGGAAAYFGARAISGIDMTELVAVVDDDLAIGVARERLLFALIMLAEWHAASSARVGALRARYSGK
jgi:asparagine synthase (glutamine-hydrolysing)